MSKTRKYANEEHLSTRVTVEEKSCKKDLTDGWQMKKDLRGFFSYLDVFDRDIIGYHTWSSQKPGNKTSKHAITQMG